MCKWFDLLWVRGDRDATAAMLDAYQPVSRPEQFVARGQRAFVHIAGMLAGVLDAEQIADAQREAQQLVTESRASGDELYLAFALWTQAYSLINGGRPSEGIAAAAEGVAIAEDLGAAATADGAGGARARGLVALAVRGDEDRVRAVRELRHFLAEADERRNRLTAATFLDPLAVLLADDDPREAYLFSAVYRRAWSTASILPPEIAAALGPDVVDELDRKAATIDLQTTIDLARDILDRWLAAN
jgi:hypothetical protein